MYVYWHQYWYQCIPIQYISIFVIFRPCLRARDLAQLCCLRASDCHVALLIPIGLNPCNNHMYPFCATNDALFFQPQLRSLHGHHHCENHRPITKQCGLLHMNHRESLKHEHSLKPNQQSENLLLWITSPKSVCSIFSNMTTFPLPVF